MVRSLNIVRLYLPYTVVYASAVAIDQKWLPRAHNGHAAAARWPRPDSNGRRGSHGGARQQRPSGARPGRPRRQRHHWRQQDWPGDRLLCSGKHQQRQRQHQPLGGRGRSEHCRSGQDARAGYCRGSHAAGLQQRGRERRPGAANVRAEDDAGGAARLHQNDLGAVPCRPARGRPAGAARGPG